MLSVESEPLPYGIEAARSVASLYLCDIKYYLQYPYYFVGM